MAHPAVGGKGLPPVVSAPVYIPSSPAASSVVSGYAPPSHHHQAYHATTAGPPPDLTVRIQLKLRYLRLQSKYNRSIEVSPLSPFYPTSHFECSVSWLRTDPQINGRTAGTEGPRTRTRREGSDSAAVTGRSRVRPARVFRHARYPRSPLFGPHLPWHSLIIDQVYDSDYAHLLPKRDSLFSDDDDEEDDGSADEEDEAEPAKVKAEEDGGAPTEAKDRKGKRKMEERDLDELEAERRTELEARYGIDGTRRNVRVRLPILGYRLTCMATEDFLLPKQVSRVPTPPPAPTPAPQQQAPPTAAPLMPPSLPSTAAAPSYPAQPASGSIPSAVEAPAPAAAPKRLKFKFGGGGGA